MNRWFAALPLHRKIVAMAVAVSTCAVLAAVLGFAAFDVIRFRTYAADDAQALAAVIAENTSAALVFDDAEAAGPTLASVHARPVVSRVCVYRVDGSILAAYERNTAARCPSPPVASRGWRAVAILMPVVRNGNVVGTVYVERTLEDLGGLIFATGVAGGLMLLIGGVLAVALAHRLQRTISRPIVELAAAARAIGGDQPYQMPALEAAPDETGALVRAFRDMVEHLLSANEALRLEIEARTRMQAEREILLAREREASRLKDEFLAAVSHELRTPLNAIVGWTQVLASTTPSPETITRAIDVLSRNARAQQRVIDDLIDSSRIVTGKLQIKMTGVDLRSVVESSIEVVAPAATSKNIHLDWQPPAAPCLVHADYDRLRQVTWNLLSNALKFTPAGGAVRVRIDEDADTYALTVSDTGIGIREDFLSHVFERFRQADGSTTREQGGLGLGLAIVKELTELHGGTVRAASAGLGQGATFVVTLRRLTGAAAPEAAQQASPDRGLRLDGLSVLAVDDNPDGLALVMLALTDAGATVHVAGSGTQALAQSERQWPDVVLCDLAMPQMDGFEVLRRLQVLGAARSRTPVVLAVSAYATGEYKERSLRAGFTAYVTKPFNTSELVHAVATAAARS